METYNFYLDQKVSTWMRTDFEIKAESYSKAVVLAREKAKSGTLDEEGWSEVDFTQELLSTKDNGNQSTEELYSSINSELLYDNANEKLWDNTNPNYNT
jgi:D-mannonate dehydratase